jgi:hypothetical protein
MTKRRRAVAIVTILLAGGALLAQKPDPASEPRRRVLVLDENAMPVPNAALAFRSLDDGVAVEDLSVDLELAFAALPRVLTDANGVASLPTGLAAITAVARAGERFGAAVLGFDDPLFGDPILWIAPDRTVQMIVRGEDGKPRRGVPVEARPSESRAQELDGFRRVIRAGTIRAGVSDGDGRLTLHHAQCLCSWNRAQPTLRMRALVAGAETPFVEVDLRRPQPEPIVLRCPPFGLLAAHRWIDKDTRDGLWLRLQADLLQPEDAFPILLGGESTASRGGIWTSYPAALGHRWRLYDASGWWEVDGPTRDGQTALVDLHDSNAVSAAPRVKVSAVLEGPDGSPCARAVVALAEPHGEHSYGSDWTSTDEFGRVQFGVEWTSSDPELTFFVPSLKLVLRRALVGEEKKSTRLDLGRLRLQPARFVCSGRLVDAATRLPVRGEVSVSGVPSNVPTAADGTFAIWDVPRAYTLAGRSRTLSVSGPSWVWPKKERAIEGGAKDLEIALERPLMLRYAALVDPRIDWFPTVRAVHVDGTERSLCGTRDRAGLLEYAERLPADRLAPEAWRIEVVCDGLTMLQTKPGEGFERSLDGLKVTVDLRGKLAEFYLRLTKWFAWPGDHELFVREQGQAGPWRKAVIGRSWARVLGRPGTRLEAILCPYKSPPTRALLLADQEIVIDLPAAPVLEVDVQAPGVPADRLGAEVLLLERRAPASDALESDGGQDLWKNPKRRWPMALAEFETEDGADRMFATLTLHEGRFRTPVPRLGVYVVVPYLLDGSDRSVRRLLLDHAVVVEAKQPGELVRGAMRIDASLQHDRAK